MRVEAAAVVAVPGSVWWPAAAGVGGGRDEDIELALHAATYGGARALGPGGYGLAVGAPP